MLKLLAILLPALIDLVNRKITDSDTRFWVSVGICSFFGIFINAIETNLYMGIPTLLMMVNGMADSILVVFGLAQLSYKTLWENSSLRNDNGLNAKLQNLDP